MSLRYIDRFRVSTAANRYTFFTAVSEVAVIRHIDRIRNIPRDAVESVDFAVDDRFRSHQANGVWVQGMVEYFE